MSMIQRIENFIRGILTIVCSVAMMIYPDEGYLFVALILTVSLLWMGLRYLSYYFSMARFMVGGRSILYIGIIILDLGIVTYTLSDSPKAFVLLYLLLIHAFSGLVDILRGLEARRLEAPSWRLNASQGLVNVVMAVICIVFVRSTRMLVYIYCLGLLYSGCLRIISSFRRTEIVYIP